MDRGDHCGYIGIVGREPIIKKSGDIVGKNLNLA